MFAKVFTQIFDSSVAEDYLVRLVFEDFLKLADKSGVVDMTPESIARRTNVPLEIVRRGITELEKPDKRSRSAEAEGRRIVRLDEHRDWGWLIVSYQRYRAIGSEEQRRARTVERTRAWRNRKGGDAPVTHGDASDAKQKQKEEGSESPFPPGFPSSENEAAAHAAFVGCLEAFARQKWNDSAGRGGKDHLGQPITHWRRFLRACTTRETAKAAAQKRPSPNHEGKF